MQVITSSTDVFRTGPKCHVIHWTQYFQFISRSQRMPKRPVKLLRRNNEPKTWACMETGLPQTESLRVRFFRFHCASETTSTSWDWDHPLPSSNQDVHTGVSAKLTVPEYSKSILKCFKLERMHSFLWLSARSALRNKMYKLWSQIFDSIIEVQHDTAAQLINRKSFRKCHHHQYN